MREGSTGGTFLTAFTATGLLPGGVIVMLLAGGALSAGAGLAALAIILGAGAILAAIWSRDMELLEEALRAAGEQGSDPAQPAGDGPSAGLAPSGLAPSGLAPSGLALSHAAAAPRLPAVERAARAIERLARAHGARAARLGQVLRTNEAIIDRLPDPLLVLGPDRAVRRANAAARTAFGADMAAVLRHPGLRGAIDRAFDSRALQTAELYLAVPVAREVQATIIVMDATSPEPAPGSPAGSFTGEPAAGRPGERVTAIAVLSDRTRERAVERMRADFVANASHELRTPLASLIGFIDTLRGPAADDPPAQQRFLAIMAEQAQRMNRLIDDLLSLSRIELTEHQPPAEQFDLGKLAIGIAEAFEPRVRARRVRLQVAIAEDLPPIIGDYDQMAQVLQNLIDNAVKYGREAGQVRVSLALAVPGGKWPTRPGVVLAVADDGPGIPRAHVPRLTERFYRVDKGRSRNAGGTGLGLAIVKHIVNRHRGQLAIESEEGRGAVFSVWLPVIVRTGGD
jgi:two-component system phosphate regulon sensor histidine kinase PhoR